MIVIKDVVVREATLDDYDALLRFEQALISAERPFDPTLRKELIHYYDIKELILSANTCLAVAARGEQLIGCGYARIDMARPWLNHERYSYLGFMYTVPEFRGQGVNHRIMESLKAWSLSRGIGEMRLEVYAGNIAAQKAYQKAGFSEHMIQMRVDLDNNSRSSRR